MLCNYSWRGVDLEKLEKELLESGFDVKRKLDSDVINLKSLKTDSFYLFSSTENLDVSFYPKKAYTFIKEFNLKEENFTSKDKKLAQIVAKYYPHKRSLYEIIVPAGIIGLLACIGYLLYCL